MSFIGFLFFIMVGAYLVCKASEIWFLEDQQASFKETLRTIENYVSDKGPDWLALTPLHYLAVFLDRYFGNRLISKRSMKLISLVSICLVISTIWFTSLTHTKDNFLRSTPWKEYRSSMHYMKWERDKLSDEAKDEKSRAAGERLKKRYEAFLSLDSVWWEMGYTVAVFVLCGLSVVFLSSISLAITRQTLREMIFARGVLTLLGGTLINVFLVLILGSSVLLFLLVVFKPAFWPLLDLALYVPTLGAIWSLVVFSVSTLMAWFMLAKWVKLVVLVPLFPCIILILVLSLCGLSYFFKEPLHFTVLRLLRRSIEWKGGPFAFLVTVFLFFTILISLLGDYVF